MTAEVLGLALFLAVALALWAALQVLLKWRS
jgi:hypothetical protein